MDTRVYGFSFWHSPVDVSDLPRNLFACRWAGLGVVPPGCA